MLPDQRADVSRMAARLQKSGRRLIVFNRTRDKAQSLLSEAVTWANDSDYGLASSVWTSDIAKGMATAARLHYGCTWINTHFMLVNEMPHGGLKSSGYGKDLSMYALEDYTLTRHVMVKL